MLRMVRMLRILIPVVASIALPILASAGKLCPIQYNCGLNGHFSTEGNGYPYTEEISTNSSTPQSSFIAISYGESWKTIQSGCLGLSGYNIRSTGAFNLIHRGYIRLEAFDNSSPPKYTTAAPGARFEVRFLLDGTEVGWYSRTYNGSLPQGDMFLGTAQAKATGNHKLEMQARMVSPGTIVIGQQWLTGQGSPTTLPSNKSVNGAVISVSGWTKIAGNLAIVNNSGAPVDLYLGGYFQVDSGNPGEWLSIGFSVDDAPSARTSDVTVPQYAFHGINAFDHVVNVPTGTHYLSMWLTNRSGGTVSIRNRRLEFVAFPSSTAIGQYYNSPGTPTLADTRVTNQPQPLWHLLADSAGPWTLLGEFTVPVQPSAPENGNRQEYNLIGEGYIEFLGRVSRVGDSWANERGQIAIEELIPGNPDIPVADVSWVDISIPAGVHDGKFIFVDALQQGFQSGLKYRLWIRKLTAGLGSGHGAFNVGKRYFSIKLVPIDDQCAYR